MNKIDVIMKLAEKKSLSEKKATKIVNFIFKSFTNELKNGGRIVITGLGSFNVRKYKTYKGRNPGTGKTIEVKPKRAPFFRMGKELKKRLGDR